MKGPVGCLPRYVWRPPNIGGGVKDLMDWSQASATGSFSVVSHRAIHAAGGESTGFVTLNFNASDADDTYAGSKVQTSALQVLCCIKS